MLLDSSEAVRRALHLRPRQQSDDDETAPRRLVARAGETEALAGVLTGFGGAIASVVGAFVIATTTVSDRFLTVPFLHERPRDVVIHASLEIVIGALLWVACASAWTALVAVDRRVPEGSRRFVRPAVAVGAGVAAGIAAHVLVFHRSARLALLPSGAWLVVLPLIGAVLGFGLYRGLRASPPWPRAFGFALVSFAVLLHLFGLHRYARHYSNIQAFLLVAVVLFSALGSGLLLGRLRSLRATKYLAAFVLIIACFVLAVAGPSPSHSTRRAVLVWGGVAKRVLLHVVWPLADRDGDGTPSSFWGVDPDDRDARVTPSNGPKPWPKPAAEPAPFTLGGTARHNLLWITVDTVRADSFERIVADNQAVRRAFAGFARHTNYVSCSSRTSQMTRELFVESCDFRRGIERRSLLDLLRRAGYRDELLAHLDIRARFTRQEQVADDRELVERARKRLGEPGEGRAVFVHLNGGHAPYDAPGDTVRARYENALERSFESVAGLVSAADDNRWVVVVVGDHGENFGEHGAINHATTLYEAEVRTAFLIRAPDVSAGPRADAMSCNGAALATLHALGILEGDPTPLPYQYAALDIAAGEVGHLRNDRWRALRVGSKKAIWSPDLGIWELYDLAADPGELRSLADSRPAELAPLRKKVEELTRNCPPPERRATVSQR